jgi:hypothetical protein
MSRLGALCTRVLTGPLCADGVYVCAQVGELASSRWRSFDCRSAHAARQHAGRARHAPAAGCGPAVPTCAVPAAPRSHAVVCPFIHRVCELPVGCSCPVRAACALTVNGDAAPTGASEAPGRPAPTAVGRGAHAHTAAARCPLGVPGVSVLRLRTDVTIQCVLPWSAQRDRSAAAGAGSAAKRPRVEPTVRVTSSPAGVALASGAPHVQSLPERAQRLASELAAQQLHDQGRSAGERVAELEAQLQDAREQLRRMDERLTKARGEASTPCCPGPRSLAQRN